MGAFIAYNEMIFTFDLLSYDSVKRVGYIRRIFLAKFLLLFENTVRFGKCIKTLENLNEKVARFQVIIQSDMVQ